MIRNRISEDRSHDSQQGVGISSLSKNPPVVSLSVSSRVESDGGQRVQVGGRDTKATEGQYGG